MQPEPAWTDPRNKDALEIDWEYCRLQIDGIAGDPSDGLFEMSILYYDRKHSRLDRSLIPESLTYLRNLRDKLITQGWEEGYADSSTYYFRRRKSPR